jgi:predicted exporter
MNSLELANHLRLLSGYHMGTDLIDRLTAAERFQRQQREALAQAADEIERLTAELEDARRLQGNGCSPVA